MIMIIFYRTHYIQYYAKSYQIKMKLLLLLWTKKSHKNLYPIINKETMSLISLKQRNKNKGKKRAAILFFLFYVFAFFIFILFGFIFLILYYFDFFLNASTANFSFLFVIWFLFLCVHIGTLYFFLCVVQFVI